MTDEAKASASTPAATLERHIMDPNIPKGEAEWWARNRIETQAREIERLRNKLGFAIRTLEEEGYSNDGPTLTSLRAALGESHDQ